jgi:hypothetical protein
MKPFGIPYEYSMPVSDESTLVLFPGDHYNESIGGNTEGVAVFAGPSGSGKTRYLSHKVKSANCPPHVIVDACAQLGNSKVVQFSNKFRSDDLTEMWSQLWHCAVVRSLLSYLMCDVRFAAMLTSADLSALGAISVVRDMSTLQAPVGATSQVVQLISSAKTKNEFHNYFADVGWSECTSIAQGAVDKASGILYCLDVSDEEKENSPLLWRHCLSGLFYCLVQKLNNGVGLNRRFQVASTISDHVVASVLRSHRGARYRGDERIRVLNWRVDGTKGFLENKIAGLNDSFLMNPNTNVDDPMVRWLGRDKISLQDGREMCLFQFLVMNTRLIPADIIRLGNDLCDEVTAAKLEGRRHVSQCSIEECVFRNARISGDEQIAKCAHDLISMEGLGRAAAERTGGETYVGGGKGFVKVLRGLVGMIQSINGDVFSLLVLRKSVVGLCDECGFTPELVQAALWRHRIVGRVNDNDQGNVVRYARSIVFSDDMPMDADARFGFHSTIRYAVDRHSMMHR